MESGALKQVLDGVLCWWKGPVLLCEQVCACYSGQTEPERAGLLLGSSAEGKTWKAAGKV